MLSPSVFQGFPPFLRSATCLWGLCPRILQALLSKRLSTMPSIHLMQGACLEDPWSCPLDHPTAKRTAPARQRLWAALLWGLCNCKCTLLAEASSGPRAGAVGDDVATCVGPQSPCTAFLANEIATGSAPSQEKNTPETMGRNYKQHAMHNVRVFMNARGVEGGIPVGAVRMRGRLQCDLQE